MKVAIITDTHWGARNDSITFIDYFDKFYTDVFIPKLVEEKIDTVLMLGDTFDRRKYTNHVSLSHAKRIYFDPLEQLGIALHILVGNHDTAYKNTNFVNSPNLLLKEYDNINVIEAPKTITIDGVEICMVPWICAENYSDSIETMKQSKAEICMGHFEIAGFAMHRGMKSEEGLSKDLFKKFDMVFSGHYHHRSNDGHIYYLGNPYELTWQDYNDPRGFHLFDLQTRQLDFIGNPYTMFERVEYDDSQADPSINSYDNLANKFVKVVVVNKNDLYKFDKFITKVYNSNPCEVKIIEDFSEYTEGEIATDINLEDTLDVLSNYVDSIETDYDKSKVKTFMKTLYTEAINLEVV